MLCSLSNHADKEDLSSPLSSCTDDSSPDLRERFPTRRILFNADQQQPSPIRIIQSDQSLRSEIDRLNKLLESERALHQQFVANKEKEIETLRLKLEDASIVKTTRYCRRELPQDIMEEFEHLLYTRVLGEGRVMLIRKGDDGSLAYCLD